jgi:hypothetical protein
MYSPLSCSLTKQLSKTEKKEQGIYFSPPTTIRYILDALHTDFQTILEPSCGSGEFLTQLQTRFPQASITGIELNATIYDSIARQFHNVIHADFIHHVFDQTFDLIIGNPPYFVMKKDDVPSIYTPYFDGRPNIFILFIVKALHLLSPNGIMCFILPKNFLNCLYYNKTRKYIADHFTILSIMDCLDDYIETKQETIVIIIQNTAPISTTSVYTHEYNHAILFGIPATLQQIRVLTDHSTTLKALGFTVSVGTVVWNQVKDKLTNDPSQTRLIYSSDIMDGQLSIKHYSNALKKNYIHMKGIINHAQIVLNRGYGVGKYTFQWCLIEQQHPYLVENHLICISHPDASMYPKVMESFRNEKTKQFIDLYFGNNAVNTTELATILPIYWASDI